MSTISAIPLAEETDTLIQKKPQASLKFHRQAREASLQGPVQGRERLRERRHGQGGVLHLLPRAGALPRGIPGGPALLRVLRRRQLDSSLPID